MQLEIVVLGIFVADAVFQAERQPHMGETVLADSFHLGPGGKGSNQAVAAAKAGAKTAFISRLGEDAFADMAMSVWKEAKVTPVIIRDKTTSTGAASIFIQNATGDNAITVCPGCAMNLTRQDIEKQSQLIAEAKIFMTQLEQPIDAALCGLELARAHKRITLFNPAPARDLPEGMLALCDYITPNESEAEYLTGIPVKTLDGAKKAADILCQKGAGTAIITLGARGALIHNQHISTVIPAFPAETIVETTGAGDAFNGGFARALAQNMSVEDATRFGCATASLCVMKPGAASAMPDETEILALL